MQSDCEIMMTLDLDFRLLFCSREECSFRNVYVSMLVGTKQLYAQKWFKKFLLETPFLDDNVTSKDKRQNSKICKPISLRIYIYIYTYIYIYNLFYFILFYFQAVFVFSLLWWQNNRFIMILALAYDQNCPLRPLLFKTYVTLVQMLRLIILDFFLPGISSPVIGAYILMQ